MSDTLIVIIVTLLLVNSVGVLVLGYRSNQDAGTDRQLERRLSGLEVRVENMPTHRDLAELRAAINSMATDVATLTGQNETQSQMLRTIQTHLMEQDR